MHLLIQKIILIIIISLLYSSSLLSQSIRIMPLGDSITNGYPNGYRDDLWFKLINAQYDIDFVGSLYNGSGFDANHEGYGGYKTYEIASFVYSSLQKNPPDVILLHAGSNDVSPTQGVDSSSVTGLNDILNQIDYFERDYNHHIKVILASIINRRSYHETVTDYNRNLRNLAYSRIYNGDDINLVNMEDNAGLNSNDFGDATHPNDSGYAKMATVWFNKLIQVLPTPIPSIPSSPLVSSIQATSAIIQWQDNSNNELGFRIYHNNILIATLGANSTGYLLNNLQINTSYIYYVKSFNSLGESSPIAISFRTQNTIPAIPSNLSISSIDTDNAILRWQDNSTNELGFKLYHNNILIATVPANQTTYTLTNLKARTTYSIVVKSYNTLGLSSPIQITFTTKDDYGWLPAIYQAILQ